MIVDHDCSVAIGAVSVGARYDLHGTVLVAVALCCSSVYLVSNFSIICQLELLQLSDDLFRLN